MDKIFWPLMGFGIVLLFVSIPGYLEAAISVTFVLLVVTWIRLAEISSERESFKQKLTDYLTNIENVILGMKDQHHPTQPENSVTRDEMNESLDKMAKKLIDVENKLLQLKKTLAAAFSVLDERMKSVEEETFPEEDV